MIEERINVKGTVGLDTVKIYPITQEKTVVPTTENQEILPDDKYYALSKVIVNKVTNEIDTNIQSNNIRKGVSILGVEGNVIDKQLGIKTITENGTYKASDDNLDGYSEVKVETSGVDINDYFTTAKNGNAGTSLQSAIKKVPSNLDITKLTNLSNFFRGCYNLTEIPLLDTSKITAMDSTFAYCTGLTTIPLLDTSNVSAMGNMFGNCANLKSIPKFDMSKVANIYSMFESCENLQEIPQLNVPNVKIISRTFHSVPNLQNFGGLLNLGQAYSTTSSANYGNYTLDLSYSTKLTHDSLMNVINGLYDIKTNGCNAQGLVLGSTNLAKLTSEEIVIATNKGWTVS